MNCVDEGLRRRSPNPNSPVATSPVPSAHSEPAGTRSNAGSNSEAFARLPTIRLVRPTSIPSLAATPQIRSQSDDGGRQSLRPPVSTSVRRSESTPDPGSYPSRYTWAQSSTTSRLNQPVPPLPLNIAKLVQDADVDEPTTLKPAKSIASSHFTLRNPFVWNSGRPIDDGAQGKERQPTRLLRSLRAPNMMSKWTFETASQTSQSLLRKARHLGAGEKRAETEAFETNHGAPGSTGKDTTAYLRHVAKFPMSNVGGRDEEWTLFKWILLVSILSVLIYGLAGMCWAMLIVLRSEQEWTWTGLMISVKADSSVTMVSDPDIVIFLTLASVLCIFSFLVGLTGILLNSRPILAFYNLLLWPTFLSMAIVGYTAYKRGNLQLDRKLNQAWSRAFSDKDRLTIQNELSCCGYYTPYHDAAYSQQCYPRAQLPGCKLPWAAYEAQSLRGFSDMAFSILAFHLLNIIVALICSNHVDVTFGRGLVPPRYRRQATMVHMSTTPMMARSVSTLPLYTALSRPPSYNGRIADRLR
ncbi:hypothetical protein BD324DRAFT_682202 [Kockovaella imperatae]|uniref:Tetraspanin Tsp2 n=1 Tax=Kockovaella imperatae TaxID=4999 RepID=A0A1Y1UG72_9TREE|nr:hypothetical protein BD324DRAFT_682202 [Kockovaella imperatae]ORX36065.1 hypothetical protein BD324DRAFT_682202 [Kockovaella imperatae]